MKKLDNAREDFDGMMLHRELRTITSDYDCSDSCRICPFPGAKCNKRIRESTNDLKESDK